MSEVIGGIESAGGLAARDTATDIITINREFTISIVIVRCFATDAGSLRWKLRLDTALKPDLTVAIRMDADNERAKDYYLLPRLDMREAVFRLADNGLSLDAYRFESLETLYRMSARVTLRAVA